MVKNIKCDFVCTSKQQVFIWDLNLNRSISSIKYNLTSYTWHQIAKWCMSTLTLNNTGHLPLLMVINCTKLEEPAYKAQSVSCLQRIQSRFLSMWQYQHLPLIMVINYTNLCDPGAYSSLCILPTLSYYVTIQLWPVTTDLEKH